MTIVIVVVVAVASVLLYHGCLNCASVECMCH